MVATSAKTNGPFNSMTVMAFTLEVFRGFTPMFHRFGGMCAILYGFDDTAV